MTENRILIVEDDDAVADVLASYLRREGYQPDRAPDGPTGLQYVRLGSYSLVLLDVMLPGMDGYEVCRRLRQEHHDLPVLFLTARGEEIDQVLGLGLGADDYIVKPFSGPALMARVKAHLRRYRELKGAPAAEDLLHFPGLSIDLAGCHVTRGGSLISLTAKEFELLRFLASNRGRVFTREQIFRQVWGEDYLADDNTVMVHIRRLREKIELDPSQPKLIVTVRGLGYRFTGEG